MFTHQKKLKLLSEIGLSKKKKERLNFQKETNPSGTANSEDFEKFLQKDDAGALEKINLLINHFDVNKIKEAKEKEAEKRSIPEKESEKTKKNSWPKIKNDPSRKSSRNGSFVKNKRKEKENAKKSVIKNVKETRSKKDNVILKKSSLPILKWKKRRKIIPSTKKNWKKDAEHDKKNLKKMKWKEEKS